jgi:hypothetical protein
MPQHTGSLHSFLAVMFIQTTSLALFTRFVVALTLLITKAFSVSLFGFANTNANAFLY